MKKVFLTLAVMLVLLGTISAAAWAAPPVALYFNGTELVGAEPQMVKGRVLVPLRAISESMHYEVEYNAAARQVTVNRSTFGVVFDLDKTAYTLVDTASGLRSETESDVPPLLFQGSVYVPLRVAAEALGATVEYQDGTVYIRSAVEPPPEAEPVATGDYRAFPGVPDLGTLCDLALDDTQQIDNATIYVYDLDGCTKEQFAAHVQAYDQKLRAQGFAFTGSTEARSGELTSSSGELIYESGQYEVRIWSQVVQAPNYTIASSSSSVQITAPQPYKSFLKVAVQKLP